MAKTRIYELAKELGLENKAVLDLCTELAFEGKASHSNSLSDDEADKIRRHVIRSAVSSKKGSDREVQRAGEVVTERRVGNIIRRRKKTEEEELAEAEARRVAESEPTIDFSDVPKKMLDSGSGIPDYETEKSSRKEALARADALFAPRSSREQETTDAPSSSAEDGESFLQSRPSEDESTGEGVDASGLSSSGVKAGSASPTAGAGERRGARILGKIELPTTATEKGVDPSAASGLSDTEEERRKERVKALKIAKPAPPTGKRKGAEGAEDEQDEAPRRKRKQIVKKDDLLDYDGEREGWRGRKDKKQKRGHGEAPAEVAPMKASKRVVKIDAEISPGELARVMGAKVGEVMKKLFELGTMVTVNQLIDFESATLVASEFGFTTINTGHDEEEFVAQLVKEEDPAKLVTRPPVVTVMGHVDHGKTSLLDAIRKTSVTTGEAGGITQHIGAYNVVLPSGGSVTFLDTPGHEAFTAMRGRGAKITDIVVLVVAADDGVMPQTVEAINHARAANVPIIVAINKIDKAGANLDRVKNQLAEHQLIPEEWGGTTIYCPVSAHTRDGLDSLLENLYLQAEILELKANPDRQAAGAVVESKLDRGRGPVLTVLIQSGTLKKGDAFIAGSISGRVRALVNELGQFVDSAGPSIPVEVLGASGTPEAGDEFYALESEAEARRVAEQRSMRKRFKELARRGNAGSLPLTLESFSDMVSAGQLKELALVIKADVQGSVEAVADALTQLSNAEVQVKVVHKGVGAVSENDVQLAVASNGLVVGFNVRADVRAASVIESAGVEVVYSRVIYELVDHIQKALRGMLDPTFKERTLGHVEVRETFRVPKLGMVAGSYVTDGVVERGAQVRLLRDNIVVFEGKMASLRRFKDDVREVAAGYECGIGLEGFSDIKSGDVLEVFKVEKVEHPI